MALPTLSRTRLSWGWVLPVGLAVGLLAFALRNVHWDEVADTVSQARLGYLVLAGGALALAYLLRALRWRVLLAGERPVSGLTAYWAVWAGYLGNALLPARAGELLRCVMIGRAADVSFAFALATTMTERIVDAGVLVLIVMAYLSTLGQVPGWLETVSRTMTVIALLGILGLLLAPRLEGLIRRFARWAMGSLPLPGALAERVDHLIGRFLLGLRALQHPGRAASFAVATAVVWAADVPVIMLVAQAFGLWLTVPQALLLLAALGLASAAPSTPGYVGIYQAVAVTVLPPFGFTESQALVYIIAFQLVSYAMVSVFGTIGLWRLNTGREPLSSLLRAGQTGERLAPSAPRSEKPAEG